MVAGWQLACRPVPLALIAGQRSSGDRTPPRPRSAKVPSSEPTAAGPAGIEDEQGGVAPASHHIPSGRRVVTVSTRRPQAYRPRCHDQNGFAFAKSR
jgi:hypothetical protein